jgi:hypothetical protein
VNRRLLVDSLRRNWIALLIQAGLAATIWIAAGAALISIGTAVAASMALAQLAGPGLAVRMVAPREVLILPMSKAEIWRTRFWFGTVMVVGAVASGKLLGFAASQLWSQPAPGFETIALSTVLDVVYASAFTWLFFILPAQRPTLMGIGVAIFLLSPFVPFALSDRLPTAWNELTMTGIGLILAGAAAGVLAYLGTPVLVTAPSPIAGRAALKARGRGWLPEFPQVVGLNRLLLKIWTTALAIQVGTIVMLPLVMRLIDGVFGGSLDDFSEAARKYGLLPFEPDANRVNGVWLWILASVGNEAMSNMLRHLRALPFRAWTLTAVFLAASLITWLTAWIVLGLFHFVLFGHLPATWRLPLLLGYLGCDCLVRSLQLRSNNRFHAVILLLAVVVPVGILARSLNLSLDSVLLSLGPVAVLVAAWLSHAALTTNRGIYARKRQRGPFDKQQLV